MRQLRSEALGWCSVEISYTWMSGGSRGITGSLSTWSDGVEGIPTTVERKGAEGKASLTYISFLYTEGN